MLEYLDRVVSPGGGFTYTIQGAVCVLFDREELPWPCCSLTWKGKQPSWNRIGKRFVPDLAASRCPSYSVQGVDIWGHEWEQVLTIYYDRLSSQEKHWWYFKGPSSQQPPDYVAL
jgi:hypothetical protein